MATRYKYALIGFIFGLCFPIGAYILEFATHKLDFQLSNLQLIHAENKLLYMIDSAPIFLGIFAFLGGISKQKAEGLISLFEKISSSLFINSKKLNSDSKDIIERIQERAEILNNYSSEIDQIINQTGEHFNVSKQNSELLRHEAANILSLIQNLTHYSSIVKTNYTAVQNDIHNLIEKVLNLMAELRSLKSIALEINMMALNSSVEASKLGKQGAGFAVIARSIKNLSGQTELTNKKCEAIAVEVSSNIENLKQKLEDDREILNTCTKVAGNIDVGLTSYKTAIDEVLNVIDLTGTMNIQQKDKLFHLRNTIAEIDIIKAEMQIFLQDLLEQEEYMVENMHVLDKVSLQDQDGFH